MKCTYGLGENGIYYTSHYFNGYFSSIDMFLDNQYIDYNIKHKDIVDDIKSRLETVHKEILKYYEDCKDTGEEMNAFDRNRSDILSKYDIAKSIAKEYIDQILSYNKSKES